MIGRLSAAFEQAVDDGKLARNPCRKVRASGGAKAPRDTWNEDQVRKFITAVSADRLGACWLLSLLGLRRGEVCGLKWNDVSFTAATLSIRQTHVQVGSATIEKGPKSERGYRTLPLFQPVLGALEALNRTQLAEREAAGAPTRATLTAGSSAAMSSARLCTRSGTARSSTGCARRPGCRGSGFTTAAIRPTACLTTWA